MVPAACGGSSPVVLTRPLGDAATHDAYAEALRDAGLDGAALGRDWLAAAARALEAPVAVSMPFAERGYLPADQPAAVAFRFDVRRGRRLVVDIGFESSQPARLFVDLFETSDGNPPRHVAALTPGSTTLEYDVRRDGPHVLRVQPELLRGGRYSIAQRTQAALQPPIRGFALAAVRSGFGAPRDGGARDHHGIDIFRPRGTPVLASADGYVWLDETARGGRVVWLRDHRTRRNIYYAHLDSWAVSSGADVRVGDVLGYVGNTGNARTTPPHLHFGVYERGPTDPAPYLQRDDPPPQAVTAATDVLGEWLRVGARTTPIRRSPATPGVTTALLRGTSVRVMAAHGDAYRIVLPDGTTGVVRARDLTRRPMRDAIAIAGTVVREQPTPISPVITMVDDRTDVRVLSSFADFDFIELPDGRRGWTSRSEGR